MSHIILYNLMLCPWFDSRTEIQGGPGPPQKFSVVAAVNLYSFTILVFQNMFLCFSRSFSTFH